jgi:hypothetical protein
MNSNFQTGHLVIYRNEDRTFSPGHYIHRERQCAINAIPVDETREVLCVAEIHGVDFDRHCELPTAQAFKAAHQERVAA